MEEIKEELQDQWHHRRKEFEERVMACLANDNNATTLFLQVDGTRSIDEIEKAFVAEGKPIPHVSLWRACKKLEGCGLLKKVGVKGRSPIFDMRPWARALDMDSFVRKRILGQEIASG